MINIITLKNEATKEAYSYFSINIRQLIMKENGEVDLLENILWDNDVDAFRHAYVSGVYTLEYNGKNAEIFGIIQEYVPGLGGSSPNSEKQRNMDLWNNSIGRKYAKKAKSREDLAELLKQALENGELIISPNDTRQYKGQTNFQVDSKKPIIVLKETVTGRNELFMDALNGTIFDRNSFVDAIVSGNYPGYTVALIDHLETPMSRSDDNASNNLG